MPTTLEAGYANSDYNFWVGLLVPAKTPREIINRLYVETIKAIKSPEVAAKLPKFGADPMVMSPPEFEAYLKAELVANEKLAKATASSVSGLLLAVVPVIGVGVARLAGDRDKLTATRWTGLAIGLGGVALLMRPAVAAGNRTAILEALGTAVCYAIGPVIAARKLAGADDLAVTAASLGLASVVYVVPAALTWPRALPAFRVAGALAGIGRWLAMARCVVQRAVGISSTRA